MSSIVESSKLEFSKKTSIGRATTLALLGFVLTNFVASPVYAQIQMTSSAKSSGQPKTKTPIAAVSGISIVPSGKGIDADNEGEEGDDDFEEPEEAGVWLPIHGTKAKNGQTKPGVAIRVEPGLNRVFFASIDETGGDPVINSQIKMLTDSALDRNQAMKDAKDAYEHFKSIPAQTFAKSKDALNILIAYRGFASSKEAGDVLLNEKLKLNGLPASELAMQKHIDDTNSQVVECLMQIAMGLGLTDLEKQTDVVASGYKKLSQLVSPEEAQAAVNTLSFWHKNLRINEKSYKANLWSPSEQQEKLKSIQDSALKNDPFVSKVVGKIHKYNKKSKVSMAAGHIIEGGLGLACLVPTGVGPAAQMALTGFEMATGGSEENKLLKQIYLHKRLESRTHLLKQKAILALQNYQIGMMSKNPALVAFSESLVAEMSGDETVLKVFGQSVLDSKRDQKAAKPAASTVAPEGKNALTKGTKEG